MKSLFCGKCGKLMKIEDRNGKTFGKCCFGYDKEIVLNIAEKGKKDELAKGVFDEKESKEGFHHVCQKCGHVQSNVVDLGSPWSDESPVYLFQCKKCKNVERQADGSSNN